MLSPLRSLPLLPSEDLWGNGRTYFLRFASHMSKTSWLFGSIVVKVIPIPELGRE